MVSHLNWAAPLRKSAGRPLGPQTSEVYVRRKGAQSPILTPLRGSRAVTSRRNGPPHGRFRPIASLPHPTTRSLAFRNVVLLSTRSGSSVGRPGALNPWVSSSLPHRHAAQEAKIDAQCYGRAPRPSAWSDTGPLLAVDHIDPRLRTSSQSPVASSHSNAHRATIHRSCGLRSLPSVGKRRPFLPRSGSIHNRRGSHAEAPICRMRRSG